MHTDTHTPGNLTLDDTFSWLAMVKNTYALLYVKGTIVITLLVCSFFLAFSELHLQLNLSGLYKL